MSSYAPLLRQTPCMDHSAYGCVGAENDFNEAQNQQLCVQPAWLCLPVYLCVPWLFYSLSITVLDLACGDSLDGSCTMGGPDASIFV